MLEHLTPEQLADRAEIRDVITRYANALDRRDYEKVASCFSADATAVFGGVKLEPGIDSIIRFLKQLRPVEGDRLPGHHFLGNLLIDLDGDQATADSYLIAFGVPAAENVGAPIRVRGLRYHDRLVRQPAGWKIAERVHIVDWESTMSNQPITPVPTGA